MYKTHEMSIISVPQQLSLKQLWISVITETENPNTNILIETQHIVID